MKKAQLDVLVAFFCYAGNGGVRMVYHELVGWFAEKYAEMKADERIGKIAVMYPGDVPLTMSRNSIVKYAKEGGFDVLWMIDNDNIPDLYESKGAPAFWASSFDFLYPRYVSGVPSVVVSPYCGPPVHPVHGGEENVYVFYWEALENKKQPSLKVNAYSREAANAMTGIQPVAAGPTGCCVYTVNAFDLLPIRSETQADILELHRRNQLSSDEALRRLNMQSWYFYEYGDQEQTTKASTEDVTNTREIALAGAQKYKQDVMFCNWDSWSGHVKPKIVGKPRRIFAEQISEQYREAVLSEASAYDKVVEVDFSLPEDKPEPASVPRIKESPPNGHGVPIMARDVCGHAVKSVGHQTPLNDLMVLRDMVEAFSKSKEDKSMRIIEVGSWVGESALAMHSGLGEAGGTIYCVDTFEGNKSDWLGEISDRMGPEKIFEFFKENVGDLLDTGIKVIHGKSVDVASDLDPQEADIILLDAEHDYENVKADIEAWLPHLAFDGWMIGHDFCPGFPGVEQAVTECFLRRGCDVQQYDGTSYWMVSNKAYKETVNA